MAKTVGFNIAIGGDASKLNKELKDVQSELRKSGSALKSLQGLTKLDPSNTNAYKLQQKELAEQLEKTREKFEILKSKKQDMDKALEDGKISTKEWSEYNKELKKTSDELESLEKQYKSFNPAVAQFSDTLKTAGTKLKDTGSKVGELGGTLTKNLTAPLSVVGGAAVAAFGEVDGGLDIVISKTGATGDAVDSLKESMVNVAASVPTSFDEAGTAIGEVNTRFGLVGESLEDLSVKFIEFAKLNGTDVNASIDGVQKTLSAFNMEAEEAGPLLDALNAVGQQTGISMDNLYSLMQSNAGALQDMGLNAYQSAEFLGMVETSGINVDTMLQGLKTAQKNATEEGKSLNDAMADFSDLMKSNATDTEKLQGAYELFGTKAGSAIYNAFATGSISLEGFASDADTYLGSVSDTFEATKDPADELTQAMNDLKGSASELGESLSISLIPYVITAIEGIKGVADWFNELSPSMKNIILVIGGVCLAIGPLLVFIGNVISAVGIVTGAISGLAPVVTMVGGVVSGVVAFLATPLGLVMAGVATVVGAVALLYNKCEWFRDGVNAIWGSISKFGIDSWNGLKYGVSSVVDWFCGLPETFAQMSDSIAQGFNDLCADAGQSWADMKAAFGENLENMKGKASEIWGNIIGTFDDAKTALGQKMDGIKTKAGEAFESMKSSVSEKFEAIKQGITNPIETAKNKVSGVIDTIKGLFNFSVSLPHINMPHPYISPAGWSVGDLLKGSIPSIGISWYKKAMNRDIVLDGATIFGAMNGSLLGGGEAGREVIMSGERYDKLTDGGTVNNYITIVQREGEDEEALANRVAKKIAKNIRKGNEVWS